jgi:hypothetical protein
VGGRTSRAAVQAWQHTPPPLLAFNNSHTMQELRANVTMITQPLVNCRPPNFMRPDGYCAAAPSASDIDFSRYGLPLSFLLDEAELNDPAGLFLAGSDWIISHTVQSSAFSPLSPPVLTSCHRQFFQTAL